MLCLQSDAGRSQLMAQLLQPEQELQAVASEWRELLPSLALELLRYPQVGGWWLELVAGACW